MGELLFSVVIPTYNRADFIVKSLESVLRQTFTDFEIIIVDDGSTDNTEAVIKPFLNDRIFYYKIVNSERAAARNYGMDRTKGRYITFLDSDDIFYPDYLENAEQALKNYNYPVFFHLAYESWSEVEQKSLIKYSVKNDDIYCLIKGNHLSCIGVFMDNAQTKNFRFNEDRNLSGSEDWELWLRLASRFGLKTFNKVSAALIIHDARSVLSYDESKLLQRKNLALSYSFEDEMVRKVFGRYKRVMEAYCDTYIALHLVLAKQNRKALRYLFLSVYYYPDVLFSKRALAIIKYILLNITGLRKK
ncbi:MAG: glycosyltransferase family 2 protein [Bacteroidota bacterium]